MIDKREIIDIASLQKLHPHIVEKDYVLGWLLWGIAHNETLAPHWVFKGGTCLKKCFFETYRFSEDLDYTLTMANHIDVNFLKTVFADMCERIYAESGIEFPLNFQEFDIYENPRGNPSCQVKIAYQGPVSPRGKNMPRIKLDLTADEFMVMPAAHSRVFHPYSDCPAEGITVRSYAYVEAFAEKTRALAERGKPRDLFDVINLFHNQSARPKPAALLDVLKKKCDFKNIPLPTLADLEKYKTSLAGAWNSMLSYQVPVLPSFETFWSELPNFFAWLIEGKSKES